MIRLRPPSNFGGLTVDGRKIELQIASDGTVHVADPATATLLRTHGFTNVEPTPESNNSIAALRKTLADFPAQLASGKLKERAVVLATLRQHYGALFTQDAEDAILAMYAATEPPPEPAIETEPPPEPATPVKTAAKGKS